MSRKIPSNSSWTLTLSRASKPATERATEEVQLHPLTQPHRMSFKNVLVSLAQLFDTSKLEGSVSLSPEQVLPSFKTCKNCFLAFLLPYKDQTRQKSRQQMGVALYVASIRYSLMNPPAPATIVFCPIIRFALSAFTFIPSIPSGRKRKEREKVHTWSMIQDPPDDLTCAASGAQLHPIKNS
jgi:hypothetical protein